MRLLQFLTVGRWCRGISIPRRQRRRLGCRHPRATPRVEHAEIAKVVVEQLVVQVVKATVDVKAGVGGLRREETDGHPHSPGPAMHGDKETRAHDWERGAVMESHGIKQR